MNSELIINSSDDKVTIAHLEEKQLVGLNSEKKDSKFSVGDIYLGKVKKIAPGLNAAFIDVGYEKDAFLHYLDLGPQIRSLLKYLRLASKSKLDTCLLGNFNAEKDIQKSGKMTQVLSSNQWVVVQVAKEPISTKGPRLTSEISLAGRYVVLVPFADNISISQKIKSSAERNRLKRLAASIKPKNFSIIVRTVAAGKSVADLDKDIQDLMSKWKRIFDLLKQSRPPQKLLGELDRTSTILRDFLNPNFNSIYVDDNSLADDVRNYIKTIAPEQEKIVKLHKGRKPIFDYYGIDRQIKNLFGKTVNMPGGAYLIIEHTEALHVIDVNSGGRTKSGGSSQANQALDVNLRAAKEIARQLRLRDLGGIIVVDFIDMHSGAHRKQLFESLKEEMRKDSTKHTILPPSKFGLIQITRQRVRPETQIKTSEKCPSCNGTGEIKASVLLVDDIENNIRYFVEEQNEKKLTLHVHPYVASHLTKGLYSQKWKWFFKYKAKIKIQEDKSFHLMQYRFYNRNDEEIKLE